MQLKVCKIHQMASGGSFVVIYEATVTVTPSPGVLIELETVEPSDSPDELVRLALHGIRGGIEHVLAPTSRGASIVVHRLGINSVDFKQNQFMIQTALEFERLMSQDGSSVVV